MTDPIHARLIEIISRFPSHSAAARAIGANPRSMRRWLSGARPVTPETLAALERAAPPA